MVLQKLTKQQKPLLLVFLFYSLVDGMDKTPHLNLTGESNASNPV
jgi:hypothetical protein